MQKFCKEVKATDTVLRRRYGIKNHKLLRNIQQDISSGVTRGLRQRHRHSQGDPKGPFPPKFLENIVILCFERCFSKQNIVIRLKLNILSPRIFVPPQILGLTTPLASGLKSWLCRPAGYRRGPIAITLRK